MIILNPKPEPNLFKCWFLLITIKGLQILSISSLLNPTPESETEILIFSFISLTDNLIKPLIVNLYEFDNKFIITCFNFISFIEFIFFLFDILKSDFISIFFFSKIHLDWNILKQNFKQFIKLKSSFFSVLNPDSFLANLFISKIKFIPKSHKDFKKLIFSSSLNDEFFCFITILLFSIKLEIEINIFLISCAHLAKYNALNLNSFSHDTHWFFIDDAWEKCVCFKFIFFGSSIFLNLYNYFSNNFFSNVYCFLNWSYLIQIYDSFF